MCIQSTFITSTRVKCKTFSTVNENNRKGWLARKRSRCSSQWANCGFWTPSATTTFSRSMATLWMELILVWCMNLCLTDRWKIVLCVVKELFRWAGNSDLILPVEQHADSTSFTRVLHARSRLFTATLKVATSFWTKLLIPKSATLDWLEKDPKLSIHTSK